MFIGNNTDDSEPNNSFNSSSGWILFFWVWPTYAWWRAPKVSDFSDKCSALSERSEFAQTRKIAVFEGWERYWDVLFFGSFLVDSAVSLAAAYETYAFGADKQKKWTTLPDGNRVRITLRGKKA